jgi:hypothetical protein
MTSYLTLTGTGATTIYQTLTQVSSVPTVTESTSTTTAISMVPVQVLATVTYAGVSTVTQGEVGCGQAPGQPQTCTTQTVTKVVTFNSIETGYMMAYSPSTVQGAVTIKQTTNVATTVFSTSASTTTYATPQMVSITTTQTLTSVAEQTPTPTASISDMLMQNLWAVLVLFAVALGVLGFSLGRRGGRGSSKVSAARGFCSACGFRLTQDSEFCPKCGTKRTNT